MTFPAYSYYRDSGVEWLGVVPEHWGVKPLRYLGRFRKGLTITKADLTDTGIPCLNYGEVHSLYPFEVNQDIHALKCVPAEYLETEPSSCISYGDFVFADTSEDLEGVGNFTHVSGTEPLFAGYHTIIYSLDSDVNSRFLAYCLESFAFRTQLRMGVKGVKVFSVTQEILRGGIAWIPTTAEQTQIARFLDHETARIDALIEEQQRLIELLKEKRQAVISHAVTKGLDPIVSMKDSGVEWLGEVPAHWDVSRLKYHSTRIGDGLHSTPEYDDAGDYFFINGNNLVGGAITIAPTTRQVNRQEFLKHRVLLDSSTVLISINGTIGNLALYSGEPVILGKSAAYINCTESLSPRFCLYLFSSEQIKRFFESQLTGTTIYNLSLRTIAETPTPLPPIDEQNSIVEFLNRNVDGFDELIDNAMKLAQLLQERRSALISAAVTGKIDVRGWQPPASEPTPELVEEAV
ncbi:restriction endonuclease subunit S [Pseudomonas sp. KU26590]|uniref:restriction endonuclease subunit S n=1 Tax=Pseudomonas sp. KU26590 TaxID=2991051 RepID=UPI00223D5329|nr:restriction endonuclease subunit S [Pseudomonas sp. KU26590]UZJ61045.1 restriction endonuclease subunit S [Pseudomonas sp. KU26590]